MLINITLDF